MLKIIDGKRYDTETATEVASYWNGLGGGDFGRVEESLYITAKGSWFIAGSGGPMSSYAQSVGNGQSGGEGIRPLSPEEAMAWLEKNDETDALDQYFAEAIEDA
tara:strand:+ start:1524 stop:1835 length:312 start_codon:yes stop_codon:yes gene_type:complete